MKQKTIQLFTPAFKHFETIRTTCVILQTDDKDDDDDDDDDDDEQENAPTLNNMLRMFQKKLRKTVLEVAVSLL